MKPSPTPVRLLTLLIGAVSTVLALGGVAAALFAISSPIWGMLSFEVVILVASALALLTGLGRFKVGFGMSCAVLGATIAAAAVLGTLDARTNLSAAGSPLARFVTPVLLVRVAFGAGLAGLGGIAVLARRPAEWKRLILGAALTAPVAIVGLALVTGRLSGVLSARTGGAEFLRLSALFFGGVLAIALLSAGGHLLITAFERCRDDVELDRA